MRSLGFQGLKGIVESDETFFKESFIGRKVEGRDPKRGISSLKIAVVVAQESNGQVVVRKAGRGRVRAEKIDAWGVHRPLCFVMH
ncbi:hypothetical protein [Bacillus sp. FJAT-49736]|uniref:hypothetical protein n=1 Tax=Bacillus sp. FJAT-49736 TaxID=2833582 RepID=UPI0020168BAF|nr:hypothetical protein [Bacillus sp. FJAT-49736]